MRRDQCEVTRVQLRGARLAIVTLGPIVQDYFSGQPSPINPKWYAYMSGKKKYRIKTGLSPIPVSEHGLIHFVVFAFE